MIKKAPYIFNSMFHSMMDIIFPNRCEFCGSLLEGRSYICNNCELKLEYINGNTCNRCGAPVPQDSLKMKKNITPDDVYRCYNCDGFDFSFNKNESLYVYSGMIRKLIHMYKFERRWKLYSYFSDKLVKYKSQYIKEFDFIIAVPLNRARLKKRGYNQSSLIAEEISKRTGVVYLRDILHRKGYSKPQSVAASVEERYINMKDKIEVDPKFLGKIKNRNILIFDDILTTGITASICADALYNKKAKNVSLLTIARTLR